MSFELRRGRVAATLAAASRDDSTFWHGLGSVRRLTFGAATINSLFLSLIAFGLWQLASTWPHGERLSRHARLSSSRRG